MQRRNMNVDRSRQTAGLLGGKKKKRDDPASSGEENNPKGAKITIKKQKERGVQENGKKAKNENKIGIISVAAATEGERKVLGVSQNGFSKRGGKGV